MRVKLQNHLASQQNSTICLRILGGEVLKNIVSTHPWIWFQEYKVDPYTSYKWSYNPYK